MGLTRLADVAGRMGEMEMVAEVALGDGWGMWVTGMKLKLKCKYEMYVHQGGHRRTF